MGFFLSSPRYFILRIVGKGYFTARLLCIMFRNRVTTEHRTADGLTTTMTIT